ncbi:Membrane-bound lysozyme-inhibitor of c-type lysozyme [Marinibacterium anthonyi]|nr:Membrane-bound lysozyme-inhibitor of c-type lysozyme [Marinibacterium anthonyi]
MYRTATGLALFLWPLAVQADPSFDCAKAESAAEKAVCASPDLAAMDTEVTRLFDLALHGPHMTDDAAATLKAYQRGWIKGRDDCWKADDLQTCVRNSYAVRIDELRRDYADARAEDGPSLGPYAYVCDGIDAGISASFVNTGDSLVVLRWQDIVLVLPQGMSGSGARYEADDTVFWIKGDDATLTLDGTDHACHTDTTG